MAKSRKFGLMFLAFFVALVVAQREVPEVFSLADDTSNDGDVIVQTIEVEATLARARVHVPTPFAAVGDGNSLCCDCRTAQSLLMVAPLNGRGTNLLSILKLRRI